MAPLCSPALAGYPPGGRSEGRAWEDEIVYVVIIQKFFNGDPANDVMANRFARDRDRYEGGLWGGDLQGVRSKLGDLADLGVTALLLYPVIQNDQGAIGTSLPTGYRPKNYFRVDENFGDIATLKKLVEEAHARGLRVILDLPLGMPGFEHPYVTDPSKAGWFGEPTAYGVRRWDVTKAEVADYLIAVARFWKERSGCDGFRLDSAQLHPAGFWRRFVAELKGARPGDDFLVLAELPVHPKEIGRLVREVGFDGAYDFSAMTARSVFGGGEHVDKLSFVLKEGKRYYDSPRSLMAQLDNYESSEFMQTAREPKQARMRAAMLFLLTLDRVPLIYSGDELALAYRDVGAAFRVDRRESAFLGDIKHLIAVRKAEPALRRGAWVEVEAGGPVYAFLRVLDQESVLVVVNSSNEARALRFQFGVKAWKDYRLDDLLTDMPAKLARDDSPIELGAVRGAGAQDSVETRIVQNDPFRAASGRYSGPAAPLTARYQPGFRSGPRGTCSPASRRRRAAV